MSLFGDYFSRGGGGSGGLSYALVFTSSGTFTAPFACTVALLIQPPGGSGAANTNATGGNSAGGGLKQITLAQGDVLTITIGAPGAGVTGGVNGNAGGSVSVQLNGAAAFLSGTGGEGGLGNAGGATLAPATVASSITGADVSYPGIQAGAVTAAVSSARTGGAAVNVTGDGMGRSPSISTGSVSGAGGSVGRTPVANATVAVDALNTSNFLTFGFFPTTTTGKGSDGNSAGAALPGNPFGGGGAGGGGAAQNGGQGGLGAGGGGCGSTPTSGAGGPGCVCLLITKQ